MDEPLDQVSTKLVQKVQLLSKKPSLDTDISHILEECLKYVEEQSLYLENGIFNFNLAAVAIVLEHVTLIYGKKVDLLWDKLLNYQKDLLKFNTEQSKIAAEQKLIDERLEKYKRRRKKVAEEEPIKRIDIKSLIPQLSIQYSTDDTLTLKEKVWQDFLNYPTDLEKDPVDRYLRPFVLETSYPIHINNEYLCDNAQILTNHYHYELWDFIRQAKYNFLGDTDIEALGYDLRDEITQKFLVENNIKLINITEEETRELNKFIEQELLERLPLQQRCKRLCPRRSSIMLTRLSQDVMDKYLKKDRMSVEDTSGDNHSVVDNDSGISELNLSNVNVDAENQQTVTEDAGNLPENDSNDVFNSNIIDGSIGDTTEGNDNMSTNIENNKGEQKSDPNVHDTDKEEDDHGFVDDNIEADIDASNYEENSPNMTIETTVFQNKAQKTRKSKVKITDEEAPLSRKRLCKRREVFKLRKVITRPLAEFELFFFEHYKPHSNEGQILIDDFIREIYLKQSQVLKSQIVITRSFKEFELFYHKNYRPGNEEGIPIEPIFTDMPLDEATDADDDNIFPSQDSGICEDIEIENEIAASSENLDATIIDNVPPITTSTPISDDKLNEPSTSKEVDTSLLELFKEQQKANEKYFEWKKGLDQQLSKTDKSDFDIHTYETRILDMLPNDEPVKFNKLMQGKKPPEVARLFIASLQLVNNLNIKLVDETPGEVANDTLQFQLLNRDRHHEHLETYIAPSLENRAVTLERIRSVKRCQASTSRDTNSADRLPCKRRKLT